MKSMKTIKKNFKIYDKSEIICYLYITSISISAHLCPIIEMRHDSNFRTFEDGEIIFSKRFRKIKITASNAEDEAYFTTLQ